MHTLKLQQVNKEMQAWLCLRVPYDETQIANLTRVLVLFGLLNSQHVQLSPKHTDVVCYLEGPMAAIFRRARKIVKSDY
jgi:hypothetical protein